MSRVPGNDTDVACLTVQRDKGYAGKKWEQLMEILENQR